MKEFPDRLREARIAAGLTQELLGFALGITKSSVSAWENGRETPSFRFLPRLSEALGCSLDELLGAGTTPDHAAISDTAGRYQVNDASELALLHRFRQMSARRQKALLLLLKPE